ncbi:hypothetical protein VO64_2939 [Pseudomonas synxantha]|uniref:Uncharacterized protein n=1 Tax=Pseudomonas synxantha TaxID=47883 RepID=A0AAU8TX56_9PSED|nr:hypothetical protein VO64_2939 [Pseudomonas synxantha]
MVFVLHGMLPVLPICCVGGGLPPIAVHQEHVCWLAHRNRGQAPSHIEWC